MDKIEEIILELLRVGLIAIRNLSVLKRRSSMHEIMLLEWSTLCHSLPPILLGRCDPRAVKYFTEGDAAEFLSRYPAKSDADFEQVSRLLSELRAKPTK